MVSGAADAGAARAALGRRPGPARSADADRSRDRRARGRRSFRRSAARRGWAARFGRELNATDDRAHFATTERRAAGRRRQAYRAVSRRTCERRGRSISARETRRGCSGARHQRARLAYRDVAERHEPADADRRHAPARLRLDAHGLLPADAAAAPGPAFSLRALQQLLVNYLVRLRVTTHVTTAIVERLPVPHGPGAPAAFAGDRRAARASRPQDDPTASARLNAHVARLYQLIVAEFEHVLATFPLIPRDERERRSENTKIVGERAAHFATFSAAQSS